MKFLPSLAMLLVAVDCFEKATGQNEQVLFSEQGIWIWWIAGVGWILAIFIFIKK